MIFIFWLKWLHLGQFASDDYEREFAFFLSRQEFLKSAIENFCINTSNNSLFQKTPSIIVVVLISVMS